MNDENIQLDSEFTYQQYSPPLVPQITNISGAASGGAVTTIDGDAGAGATGPVVTFSGGSTGLEFTAVGTSVTMTLADADALVTALGLSKNNATNVAPGVGDDNTLGYSINSLWTDSTGPTSYICQDASTGAAVWHAIP